MLNFGNKEFRNLQEQVLKNMDDIQFILEEEGVLNQFGIKVIGQEESIEDLPSVADYKEEHEDWAYGDTYAIGEEEPYTLYVLTRANGTHPNDYWFDIGEFPNPGPQGPQGEQGETGATPNITPLASTTTLQPGQQAFVIISKSGTAENPTFNFGFNIPKGEQGIQGEQGVQGETGPQGPQGIQGQKGDTGYLYTIIGQVADETDLPDPEEVIRDGAYLVGSTEPYDVYVIIGETGSLEWINLGNVATIVPNTYLLSNTFEQSGTVDASTLTAINNETDMHYVKDGNLYFGFSGKVGTTAYYFALEYDSGTSTNKAGKITFNLTTGAWTFDSEYLVDVSHAQTISGVKTITDSLNFNKAGNDEITWKLVPNNYHGIDIRRENNTLIGISGGSIATHTHVPYTTATYDLGSSDARWKAVYTSSGLRIYNKTIADGSSGIYTNANFYSNSNNDLGISGSAWKDLYLSGDFNLSSDGPHNINFGSTAYAQIASSAIYVNRRLSTGIVEPQTTHSSAYTVGSSSKVWDTVYTDNISDGTNSVVVANIANTAAAYNSFQGETNFEDDVYVDGADVFITGALSANDITEKMTGYSFTDSTETNATFNYLYCGAQKISDKLSLSAYAEITRTDSVTNSSFILGKFTLPAAVASKITAVQSLGLNSVVATGTAYFASSYYQGVNVPYVVYKFPDNSLEIRFYNVNGLMTLNTTYNVKVDLSLLLNDNLAV